MAGKQEHSLVKDKLARILIWATESLAAVTLTYAVCFDAYGSPGYGTDGGYGSPIMDTVSRSRPSLSIAPGPDKWRWNKLMPLHADRMELNLELQLVALYNSRAMGTRPGEDVSPIATAQNPLQNILSLSLSLMFLVLLVVLELNQLHMDPE